MKQSNKTSPFDLIHTLILLGTLTSSNCYSAIKVPNKIGGYRYDRKKLCPGCGRHCDLSTPHCDKGREFAKTGVLPEYNHKKEEHHGMRMLHYHSEDINDKLIINLRNINHMMRMQYEGKSSQKRILIILNESGTLTQKELTERLNIQFGPASEILSKLEDAGLIVRTQNKTDRRTTDILMTDAGTELALEAARQTKYPDGHGHHSHHREHSCHSDKHHRGHFQHGD